MAEPGPDYTLRRPVDIHQPLPIVFNQDEEEIGGYYITEDGIASKNPPPPSTLSAVRLRTHNPGFSHLTSAAHSLPSPFQSPSTLKPTPPHHSNPFFPI